MTPAPPTRFPRWRELAAGTVLLGACGVCCAGPLLALLGGIGAAALAGAVIIPALGILAVITSGVAGWLLLARRRRARNRPAAARVIDLGLPTDVPPAAPITSGERR